MALPRCLLPRVSTSLAALTLALLALPGRAASLAPVEAEHGMVVSAQHLATQVGVDVLRRGGTAVDAAVAVGYALAVVYPAAGNLGGGGFMTLQLADGRSRFIDFREKAPLAARADMYLDAHGEVVPGLSTQGYLAAGVPGSVAGLEYVRSHYGTQARASLMAPAITLAQHGFVLDAGDAEAFAAVAPELRQDGPSSAIFLRAGLAPTAGQKLVQKDLARTLERIQKQGRAGFYQGPVAAALVHASQAAGGVFTQADLDQYQVRDLDPVRCDYRGYQITSAAPPSSGGVTLCEMLNILEGYPLAALGFHSAQAVHYQIEAMRRAYYDRNRLLGDPEFIHNPVAELTDKAYAARWRATIDPQHATPSESLRDGAPAHEGSNTTHYSIADRFGNAVAVTYTLNDWFGAKVTVPGTGVLLNDEMDDFSVKPGVPNLYGLVQGEANAIAPGKRPLSSMTPTIVSQDGRVVLVLGTPGGSRIINTILLTLLNLIDYRMNLQEAVDAPRFHQQWLPDATLVENYALSPDTQAVLQSWGQVLRPAAPYNHVTAILLGAPTLGGTAPGRRRFYGANDPRRHTGLAQGF